MKLIGQIVCTVVVLVPGVLWSGYALSILWGWFIAPVFALPAITVNSAIGMALVVSYLTHQTAKDSNDDKSYTEKLVTVAVQSFFKPTFALGIGYVVKMFA